MNEIFFREIIMNDDVLQWLEKDSCKRLLAKYKKPKFVFLAHLVSCAVFCLRRNPFITKEKPFFVPSRYESYLDIYDNDLYAYTGMSFESKTKFQKDLDHFTNIFTGSKPNLIVREFSDISFELAVLSKSKDYTHHTLVDSKLIDYTNKVVVFYKQLKKGEKLILNLLLQVFDFDFDLDLQATKHFKIKSNMKLKPLINKCRDIMLHFIAETEDNYLDVIHAWEQYVKI